MWKDYFPAVDAIVFLVDVSDRERLYESKAEFDSLMQDEQVASCPVVILGNKIDKQGAMGEQDIRHVFNLNGLTTGKGTVARSDLNNQRPMELFMVSVLRREGYGEAFRWLSQYL